MKYKLLITAITALAFTACGEGKKTPDGHAMDNPPPSAYAPSDYETFDQDDYEATPANEDVTAEAEIVEEGAADEVDDVAEEAEDDGAEVNDEVEGDEAEADETDEEDM